MKNEIALHFAYVHITAVFLSLLVVVRVQPSPSWMKGCNELHEWKWDQLVLLIISWNNLLYGLGRRLPDWFLTIILLLLGRPLFPPSFTIPFRWSPSRNRRSSSPPAELSSERNFTPIFIQRQVYLLILTGSRRCNEIESITTNQSRVRCADRTFSFRL